MILAIKLRDDTDLYCEVHYDAPHGTLRYLEVRGVDPYFEWGGGWAKSKKISSFFLSFFAQSTGSNIKLCAWSAPQNLKLCMFSSIFMLN